MNRSRSGNLDFCLTQSHLFFFFGLSGGSTPSTSTQYSEGLEGNCVFVCTYVRVRQLKGGAGSVRMRLTFNCLS